ncbi:MAG: hypothetical protein ACOH2R_05485 [Pseudomonas sp.]
MATKPFVDVIACASAPALKACSVSEALYRRTPFAAHDSQFEITPPA